MSGDAGRTIRAGHRTVRVHRPHKVLFPGRGDTAEYEGLLPRRGHAPGPAWRRLRRLGG
ncbi:hypothetical protein ACL02U_00105 [Streptomyces sp. MS06]|uniref:hypothetical protein n=1 Tax=Streptomyces sp. MS06 TaxID=3385974 RepID=UPI00399FA948